MAIVFYRDVVVGALDRSSRLPTLPAPAAADAAIDGGIKFERT